VDDKSRYLLFRREGTPGNPHDHQQTVAAVTGGADSSDGIDATSAFLGPQFPKGVLVVMNSSGRNFLIYRCEDVAQAAQLK
jgi:myo-inositol-hexaphosphate 3-phosphohydrolase